MVCAPIQRGFLPSKIVPPLQTRARFEVCWAQLTIALSLFLISQPLPSPLGNSHVRIPNFSGPANMKTPIRLYFDMSYFDTNKETLDLVDASPVGLLAILSQRAKGSNNAQIIAYGSRALTSTESAIHRLRKKRWQ